jgi:uncharacterized protein YfbU (UPF0304 family)
MFRALHYAYNELEEKGDIDKYDVQFKGYDGNDLVEGRLLSYVRYFVIDLNRFQEILEEQNEHFDFNSHCPMRNIYGRMLSEWRHIPNEPYIGNRQRLTREQLETIVKAAIHPENR